MGTDEERQKSPTPTPRPYDYIWRGKRITHYLNHAGTWQSCEATAANHYTLRSSEERA